MTDDILTPVPLTWVHPLQPMQGAISFASRLAALNGRPMPSFLREMKLPPHHIDKGVPTTVSLLAELGGAVASDLLRFTPRPGVDERHIELAGELLYRHSVNRTFFRFCPACVAEDLETFEGPRAGRPWLRTEWVVSHLRSCARHKLLLANGRPLRRRYEAPDFCGTLAEIRRDLPDIEAGLERVENSPFQDWVRTRLAGTLDAGNWLDDMPLRVGMAFCEGLGVSALHPPKVKTSELSEVQWAAAADEGYRVASAGEGGILELLTRLNAAQARMRGVWGPRDTYGYVYGILAKTVLEPGWEKPRGLVANFAMDTIPLEAGTNVLGHVLDRQRVHTVRSASKATGAHALTMRKLFEREGIGADKISSGLMDHRVTVTSEDIEDTLRSLSGAMSTTGVMARTGFPLHFLRAAISEGFLETVTGSSERAYAKHRFTEAAVDRMLERMFARAVEVTEPIDGQVGLVKARAKGNTTREKVLGMVFGTQPIWKGRLPGPPSFDTLLVDVDEVVARVRSESAGTGIGKFEMLEFVPGLARDAVTPLVDAGHLTLVEEFSPAARRMVPVVSRESAERFRTTFVTLGELCQRSQLHHKQVRLLLRGAGVPEAFGFDAFGCFLYKREDIDAAEGKNVDLWHYDREAALAVARQRQG